MKIRWFAVLYPTTRLQCTNDAMCREECKTQYEAMEKCREWQEQYPGKRTVVRREVEV